MGNPLPGVIRHIRKPSRPIGRRIMDLRVPITSSTFCGADVTLGDWPVSWAEKAPAAERAEWCVCQDCLGRMTDAARAERRMRR